MFIRESIQLLVSNPIEKALDQNFTESIIADLKLKEVRAIYPYIRAINSGKLTQNYTFYPSESIIGRAKEGQYTGYSSFVKPYGKPIIREHRLQGEMSLMGPGSPADVPMGRIIYAGYRKRNEKTEGVGTLPSKKYIPGTLEGDGAMFVVPAVTDPESIIKILGGAYHTVSMGSNVENVWESISGKNIAEMRRNGEELPPFERGQLYKGALSYWKMGEIKGMELSYVNAPSDVHAGTVDPDIGEEGIRLLVAEKKSGKSKEFNFFDAKTSEKVDLGLDESVWDESFFIDSAKVGHNIWWLNEKDTTVGENITESTEVEEDKTMSTENITENQETTVEALTLSSLPEACKKVLEPIVEALASGESENLPTLKEEIFANLQEKYASLQDPKIILESALVDYLTTETLDLNLKVSEFNEAESLELNEFANLNIEWDLGIDLTNPTEGAYFLNLEEKYYSPIFIKEDQNYHPLLVINSKEELSLFVQNLESYYELYDLDNIKSGIQCGIEKYRAEVVPILEKVFSEEEITNEEKGIIGFNLFHLSISEYLAAQKQETSKEHELLATVVGLIRKNGITKEDLGNAHKAYKIFGKTILTKFLESAPEKLAEAKEETSVEGTSSTETKIETVETLPDPVAATEGTTTEVISKETSKDPWLGMRIRSKPSGKITATDKRSRNN